MFLRNNPYPEARGPGKSEALPWGRLMAEVLNPKFIPKGQSLNPNDQKSKQLKAANGRFLFLKIRILNI